MSTRQLKRLERLAVASAVAERSHDSDSDSDSGHGGTVGGGRFGAAFAVRPGSRARRKAATKQGGGAGALHSAKVPEGCDSTAQQQQQAQRQQASGSAPAAVGKDGEEEEEDEAQDWVVDAPASNSSSKRASKKKAARDAKKKKAEEEAALLAALCKSSSSGDGDDNDDDERTKGAALKGSAATAACSSAEDLLCCSAAKLDTRAERIKAFGASAVEDVGAGGGRHPQPQHRRRGGRAPVFRPCVFVTPNRNEWPPFSGLGLQCVSASPAVLRALHVTVDNAGEGATKIYVLDTSSPEHRAAQAAFEHVVGTLAGPEQLMELARRFPYHIPTLLQCNTLFAVMGDAPASQTMLDMALYALGIAMARFPFERPAASRALPHRIRANQMAFVALQRGIHTAMRRGCAKTALNLCKLVLSLDDTDPTHALLLLDYIAVRASEWLWLVRFHDALVAENSPMLALPSLHFHSALAMHLLESEAKSGGSGLPKAAHRGGGSSAAPPDNLGASTTTTAAERLRWAVRLFPGVAMRLAERVGEQPGEHPWCDLLPHLIGFTAEEQPFRPALDHVTSLFVEHAADLWKPREVAALLRAAAAEVARDQDAERHLAAVRRQQWLRAGALESYTAARREDMSGEQHQRIAPELLAPDAPFEDAADDAAAAVDRIDEVEFLVTDAERELLLRYEALFGPLGRGYPTPRRMLDRYAELLAPHEARINGERGVVLTFVQTLLPWNDVREMTLRRLFEERGIADPVRRRREAERARDDEDARRVLQSESSSDSE